jgi:hypothetical protein
MSLAVMLNRSGMSMSRGASYLALSFMYRRHDAKQATHPVECRAVKIHTSAAQPAAVRGKRRTLNPARVIEAGQMRTDALCVEPALVQVPTERVGRVRSTALYVHENTERRAKRT